MSGVGTGIAIAGGIGAAGSIAGGLINANAASSAAKTQADAARYAADSTLAMYNQNAANIKPWLDVGFATLPKLQVLTGTNDGGNPLTAPLTSAFNPTMEQLEATPGYKFTRQQGLEAVQNGFAANGLGTSGAAIKGAAQYAEGLAGSTYQQRFANDLATKAQQYAMLSGISGSGQNAAVQQGSLGANATNATNALLTSAAAASAGGTVGSAGNIAGAIGGASNSLGGSALLYSLLNKSKPGTFTYPEQTSFAPEYGPTE